MDFKTAEAEYNQRDTRSVSMSVFSIPDLETTSQDTYKKDKNCAKCGSLFLLGINPRNNCPFCHRGYCKNCFFQQALHPETNELTGICENCHSLHVQAQVNDNFDSKLIELKEEVLELREKYNEEVSKTKTETEIKRSVSEQYRVVLEEKTRKDHEVENFIDRVKALNIKLGLQSTELAQRIDEMLEESHQSDLSMNSLREEADDIQLKSMKFMDQSDELRIMINDQKADNEKIRLEVKRIEELKQTSDIRMDLLELGELELANMINSLRENIEIAKKEKKRIYKRTVQIRNEENLKDKVIQVLEKDIEIFRLKNEKSKESYELKLQLREQIKIIMGLRDELKPTKINMKSLVSKGSTIDPIEQARNGKCIHC